jgi:nucleotide-binding universal stress UspA family protein
MIKRILVALDLDSDTPIATQYALEIASRYDALVTGVAVVDMGSIEASIKGGGIGSMYFAEKLRDNLTEEAREKAQDLANDFKKALENSSVKHSVVVEEGVPFRRIVEDMKFNDVLIVGNDPHFFYSHPKKHTHTLARIVEHTIGPTIVVSDIHREVKRVLIATDGTDQAARATRRFIDLEPFGQDIDLQVITVSESASSDAELLLQLTKSYIEDHGFQVSVKQVMEGSPKKAIMQEAGSFNADLIVMGAHTRTTLRAEKLGETTGYILENAGIPVFVDH